MKRILLFTFFLFNFLVTSAQPKITLGIVPSYIQGLNGTNNNRIPMAYWAEISGLIPGANYRYYNLLDSVGSLSTKGSGNPYFINRISGSIRRSTATSFTNPSSYDSLTADLNGNYAGWFMNEPSGNIIFTPGKNIIPQIYLNDGNGGKVAMYKLELLNYPITVIDFGKNQGSSTEGSAFWDSASVSAKTFVFLYDIINGNDRPIAGTIVENDGVVAASSVETFYRNLVDGKNGHWGTIIPNDLPNGIGRVEYRNFTTGSIMEAKMSKDGIWGAGVNTVNPTNGTTGLVLNSWVDIPVDMVISDDTVDVNELVNFSFNIKIILSDFTWNFGDKTTDKNLNATHSYVSPGNYIVSLNLFGSNFEKVISDTITVKIVTSTKEIRNSDNEIEIYPNPSNGFFIINNLRQDEVEKIVVYDSMGNQKESFEINESQIRLNISNLEKGIYLLKIIDKAKNVFSRKIVVN